MNAPKARPARADVEAAASRIGSRVRRTPVLRVPSGELGIPATVVLKLELTQHSGSFKARGALNNVLSLPTGAGGVCAASGGNHAGAVSWAAQRAGVTADVFVPSNATPAKIARIGEYRGRAHLVDGYVKEAMEACVDFATAEGLPLLHPYDTFETVSGAGTLGLEIEEQVPEADLVVLGCGGGGLYAGVAAALGHVTRVQPVEPQRCPSLAAALAADGPVDIPVGGVAVDSLGAPRIGNIAFATAKEHAVRPVLVGEQAIVEARALLWRRFRLLAEPGACVALAGVLAGQVDIRDDDTVVVVVSGGNDASLPDEPPPAVSGGRSEPA